LKVSHQGIARKEGHIDASIRSFKEIHSAESSLVQENLQGLRNQKRRNGHKMPQMPQQKPAVEEARTSQVVLLSLCFPGTQPFMPVF
jgi:hypothetical protein